ncbi:MAG: NAD(P)H-dependent oxidoreductase [Bacteroidetes bacterium]|nr:MAG: NAD(P)H-dependent oxidoreductase [Bacteroidota bacterium]
MNESVYLIGMSGSLRKDSFNTRLLFAVQQLLPENVTMGIVSIADQPLYNADLDLPAAKQRPPMVQQFREALATADGFVFVSPEYNYSIPGGLKNAIDWASRGEDSPLLNKPVAVMGATPGMWGTVRMQTAFLPVFTFLNMKPILKPEILIAQAAKKFDAQGKLTDDKAKDLIRQKLDALRELILKERAYASINSAETTWR